MEFTGAGPSRWPHKPSQPFLPSLWVSVNIMSPTGLRQPVASFQPEARLVKHFHHPL
jgi:hypothetical protein